MAKHSDSEPEPTKPPKPVRGPYRSHSKTGSGKYRSAITGRFVSKSTAKRHPKTTIKESAGGGRVRDRDTARKKPTAKKSTTRKASAKKAGGVKKGRSSKGGSVTRSKSSSGKPVKRGNFVKGSARKTGRTSSSARPQGASGKSPRGSKK